MPPLSPRYIQERLRTKDAQCSADAPGLINHSGVREAAVLIIFKYRNGAPTIILTKRATTMRHHAGQIAFPGGARDPEDATLAACALREAQEEIGFYADQAHILGALGPHLTISDYRVTPFVIWDERDEYYNPTSTEASIVFEAPAANLLKIGNFQTHSRSYKGAKRQYLTIPYGPYYVWGATARMLHTLAVVLFDD